MHQRGWQDSLCLLRKVTLPLSRRDALHLMRQGRVFTSSVNGMVQNIADGWLVDDG